MSSSDKIDFANEKKVVGGAGITAGRNVAFGDVSGQLAIGEHIYQINLIYNDYTTSRGFGELKKIPVKIREQLDSHLSKIKEVESTGERISTDAYYTLGLSAYYERNFNSAENYLVKAIKMNPNNLQARNLMCRILATKSLEDLQKGRYEDVITDSKKAESFFQYQSVAESLIIMGYVYKNMYIASRQKEYLEKAKEKFVVALALEDPNDAINIAGALNGLGNYYFYLKNNNLAIEQHLEAIKIMPNYASAHNDLAIVYEAKMREDVSNSGEWRIKAIEEWKKAEQFGIDDPVYSKRDIANIRKRISDLQHI